MGLNPETIVSAFNNMQHLLALHRKQDEVMRKMVKAVAYEYLKRQKVTHTHDERVDLNAAIDMLTGEKEGFHGSRYLAKKLWPTHLRLTDLKPVRFESVATPLTPEAEILVREPGGKIVERTTEALFKIHYLPLHRGES